MAQASAKMKLVCKAFDNLCLALDDEGNLVLKVPTGKKTEEWYIVPNSAGTKSIRNAGDKSKYLKQNGYMVVAGDDKTKWKDEQIEDDENSFFIFPVGKENLPFEAVKQKKFELRSKDSENDSQKWYFK